MPELLPLIRSVIFGLVIIFSLVELGLCAKNIHVTKGGVFLDDGAEIFLLSPFFFPFAALGLAISVLTLLFIIPVLIIDFVRKGAVTSVLGFELAWTGIFWVLWLAVAGDATAAGIFDNCSYEDSRVDVICHQFPALQGLAFFNWLLLFGWFITLCVLAFNLRNRPNATNVWRQSVVSTRFSIPDVQPTGRSRLMFWKSRQHPDSSLRMASMPADKHDVEEMKRAAPVYDHYTKQNTGAQDAPPSA